MHVCKQRQDTTGECETKWKMIEEETRTRRSQKQVIVTIFHEEK